MPYTAAQLTTFFVNLHMGKTPTAVQQLQLEGYANQNATGGLSDAQTLKLLVDTGDSDTAVAVLTYQYFTGKFPTKAGLDYLVDSAVNTTDLNDPYYQTFNLENRYINFASNLGVVGDGSAAFMTAYNGLTFAQTVDVAYEKIIGSSFAVAAGIDPAAAKANIASREGYFRALANANFPAGSAAQKDIAAKAGVIGYIMAEAMKADIGVYAIGANSFMGDLALDGDATFNVDLVSGYSVPAAAVALAKSFTLTSGIDVGAVFAGGAGDDTYYADLTGTGAQTLNTNDNFDGGAGTNTLMATLKTDVTPTGLANIHVVQVTNVDNGGAGAADLNLLNASAVTSVRAWSLGDPDGIAFTNIANAVKDFQVMSNGTDVSFQVKAGALAGKDDSTVLTLSGVTGGMVTIGSGAAGSGYEAITINSAGSNPNVLGGLTDGASDALTTVNFSGSTDLTVTGKFDTAVKTFDATGFTGKLDLNLTAAAVLKVTGGEGDDTFNFGGTYVGGTTGATRDILDGGDGDDTLSTTSAIAGGLTTKQANVVAVERLRITDALANNIDTTLFADVNQVVFAVGGGAFNVAIDSGDTVTFETSSAGPNLTVAGAGFKDSATVVLGKDVTLAGLTTKGIETLTIETSGANILIASMTPTAVAETLLFTGSGAVTVGTLGADVIDASALGKGGSLTMVAAVAAANVAVTGSGGNDQLAGTTGADILVAGAGNDILYGLAGQDVIDLTGGGKDAVVLAGITTAGSHDTVSGFTVGTGADADTVQVNASDTTTATGAASNPVFQEVASAPGASVIWDTAVADVLEFSFNLTGNGGVNDLDNHLDGTGLLASLGQSVNPTGATGGGFIIAYQGGNAYLYYGADLNAGDLILFDEFSLIGVFTDVEVGGFTASNIDLI